MESRYRVGDGPGLSVANAILHPLSDVTISNGVIDGVYQKAELDEDSVIRAFEGLRKFRGGETAECIGIWLQCPRISLKMDLLNTGHGREAEWVKKAAPLATWLRTSPRA